MSEKKLLQDLETTTFKDLLAMQSQIVEAICKKHKEAHLMPELARIVKPQFRVKVGTVTPQHLKEKWMKDHTKCMLGISLGNASMEDNKLEASIRWISEHFTNCALVVGDSIYRYTLQATERIRPQESKPTALQVGRDFISKYASMINKYSDSCHFEWMCMSEVEQHANFEEYLQIYQQLYVKNSVFQTLVNESSHKYLSGTFDLSSLLESEKEKKLKITINYFLEEAAIFTCLCEENQHVLIYPGTIKPLQIITENKIEGVPYPIRKLIQARINLSKKGWQVVRNEKDSTSTQIEPAYEYKLLNRIKDAKWKKFLSYTKRKKYRSGDIIVFKNMKNKDLYILMKGSVEVLAGSIETGKLTRKSNNAALAFINEQYFLDGYPSTTTIAALTDCEVLFLSNKLFNKMLRIDPEIAAFLLFDIAHILTMNVFNERNNFCAVCNGKDLPLLKSKTEEKLNYGYQG